MAKTISQSITSIETSETSLESSLSKCKTSISNKGVSVPSTTRFSNLPALIDKIETFRYTVSHPYADNRVVSLRTVLRYGSDLIQRTVVASGSTYAFKNLDPNNAYVLKYWENHGTEETSLLQFVTDGARMEPVQYFVFADKPENIVQTKICNGNKKLLKTLYQEDGFWWTQEYTSCAQFLEITYTTNSGIKTSEFLFLTTPDHAHVHVIRINIETDRYSEYMFESNSFMTGKVDARMRA